MSRYRLLGTLAMTFGVMSFAGLPVAAGQEGARTNSSGSSTGTATSRGGDSGGGSATSRGGDAGGSSSSSNSGSGGGATSTGSSSMGSSSVPSTWSSFEAPSRSSEQGARTRSGGSTTTGSAVTRGGGGGNGGSSSPRSGGSNASAESSDSAPTRRAVPAYSRPRGDRPVTGTAVDRGSVAPPDGGGSIIITPPYYPYYPWGFWGPGYGYGLGYLYYDPFWFGGYGGYGYGGYGYGGGGSGGYAISQSYREEGSLRLKIAPRNAQVYIDGYYVGVVDSFDGVFQKLNLDGGGHRVELKADGYAPLEFEVLITPGETVTYKGDMKRIQ